MQQLAVMFKCRSGNDAVIGLADGNTCLAQFAVYVHRPNIYCFRHRQHEQWAKITLDSAVGGVVGNTLENLCQYSAAYGKVFIIKD